MQSILKKILPCVFALVVYGVAAAQGCEDYCDDPECCCTLLTNETTENTNIECWDPLGTVTVTYNATLDGCCSSGEICPVESALPCEYDISIDADTNTTQACDFRITIGEPGNFALSFATGTSHGYDSDTVELTCTMQSGQSATYTVAVRNPVAGTPPPYPAYEKVFTLILECRNCDITP